MTTPYSLIDGRASFSVDPTGLTDALASIQSALAAAAALPSGGSVFLCGGGAGFAVSAPLVVPQSVRLLGDAARVIPVGAYGGPLVVVGPPAVQGDVSNAHRPSGNTLLDSTAQGKYAVATLGDFAPLGTCHPLQLGLLAETRGNAGQYDYFEGGGALTIEFGVSRPNGVTWANGAVLFGVFDSNGNGFPYAVKVDSTGFIVEIHCNEAAYADGGLPHRWHVTADMTQTVFRVAFQVRFSDGKAQAWVRTATGGAGSLATTVPVANWPAPGAESVAGRAMLAPDGVAPFLIGYGKPRMDAGVGAITNLTLFGLRLSRSAVYVWDSGTQTNLTTPGLAISDDSRFFSSAGVVVPAGTFIANLPLDDAPTGQPWVHANSYAKQGILFWAPVPRDDRTVDEVCIEGIEFAGSMQAAVQLGQHLTLRINRVRGSGGQGRGTLPLRGSYPLYSDNCEFSGTDAGIVSYWNIGQEDHLQIPGAGRDGIRIIGGAIVWGRVDIWRIADWCKTFVTMTGSDDGLVQEFGTINVDNEGGSPATAGVSIQQGYTGRGSVVIGNLNVSVMNAGVPLLLMHTHARGTVAPYKLVAGLRGSLTAAGVCPIGLKIVGPENVHGTVDLSTLYPAAVVYDAGLTHPQLTVIPPTPIYP